MKAKNVTTREQLTSVLLALVYFAIMFTVSIILKQQS